VPGVLHGQRSLLLSDDDGQIFPAHSISAGLDYPGVGPSTPSCGTAGRAEYVSVTDDEALDAFVYLSRMEGIIPALETAHAVAYVRKLAPTLGEDAIVVVNLSGRGDKDAPRCAISSRRARGGLMGPHRGSLRRCGPGARRRSCRS
jgi:tryptophan synthase beta chain